MPVVDAAVGVAAELPVVRQPGRVRSTVQRIPRGVFRRLGLARPGGRFLAQTTSVIPQRGHRPTTARCRRPGPGEGSPHQTTAHRRAAGRAGAGSTVSGGWRRRRRKRPGCRCGLPGATTRQESRNNIPTDGNPRTSPIRAPSYTGGLSGQSGSSDFRGSAGKANESRRAGPVRAWVIRLRRGRATGAGGGSGGWAGAG